MRVAGLVLNQCPPGLKSMKIGSVTTCVATKSSQVVHQSVTLSSQTLVITILISLQTGCIFSHFAAGRCVCDGNKPSFIDTD